MACSKVVSLKRSVAGLQAHLFGQSPVQFQSLHPDLKRLLMELTSQVFTWCHCFGSHTSSLDSMLVVVEVAIDLYQIHRTLAYSSSAPANQSRIHLCSVKACSIADPDRIHLYSIAKQICPDSTVDQNQSQSYYLEMASSLGQTHQVLAATDLL